MLSVGTVATAYKRLIGYVVFLSSAGGSELVGVYTPPVWKLRVPTYKRPILPTRLHQSRGYRHARPNINTFLSSCFCSYGDDRHATLLSAAFRSSLSHRLDDGRPLAPINYA